MFAPEPSGAKYKIDFHLKLIETIYYYDNIIK